jgi:hypothetical protein
MLERIALKKIMYYQRYNLPDPSLQMMVNNLENFEDLIEKGYLRPL